MSGDARLAVAFGCNALCFGFLSLAGVSSAGIVCAAALA